MRSFMYTIKAPVGMHARHAGILVKQASLYHSEITLSGNGRSANAKSVLALMGLGIRQGDLITVTAEGDDEDTAAAELRDFIWTHF